MLGCGNFGGIGSAPAFFGQGETKEQAFALMDAAWELGLDWFDTADAYGGGRSEAWIGDVDRARPATGRGSRRRRSTRWTTAPTPGSRRSACCASSRRASSGSASTRVDLYLAHEPDPETPVARDARRLRGARRGGLVEAWGVSNFGAAELREALDVGTPVARPELVLAARPRRRGRP